MKNEKNNKNKKINKKKVIALVIVIILIVAAIYILKPKHNKWTSELSYEGDFNGDGKKDILEVKTKNWTEKVAKNVLDDNGHRSKTEVYLNNKKLEGSINYKSIEILDYDNDGIDEIKTTYIWDPPSSQTRTSIYKINNKSIERLDDYRIQTFEYTSKGYIETTPNYYNSQLLSMNTLDSAETRYYDFGKIETQWHDGVSYTSGKLTILLDGEVISELTINSLYDSNFSNRSILYISDYDLDGVNEIINPDKTIVIKTNGEPKTKDNIIITSSY